MARRLIEQYPSDMCVDGDLPLELTYVTSSKQYSRIASKRSLEHLLIYNDINSVSGNNGKRTNIEYPESPNEATVT